MENNPTQTPKSATWPNIRAEVLKGYGDKPMEHELPDGTIMRATVAQALEQCVELDVIGSHNPAILLGILQKGMNRATES